jgi:hypothetical protein
MNGDAKVRDCSHCNRKVYNLSEMSRYEAMSLILRTEGQVCVRYYRRDDGRVMTRDCGRAVRRRGRLFGFLSMLLTSVGFGAFWLRTIKPDETMGSVMPAPIGLRQGAVAVKVKPEQPLMGKLMVPRPGSNPTDSELSQRVGLSVEDHPVQVQGFLGRK